MIEITHQQARQWLRITRDAQPGAGGLSNVQWAALHAHLEICPECRAQHRRLSALEKDLRRAMMAMWPVALGPGEQTGLAVIHRMEQRRRLRQRLQATLVFIVLLFLFVGVFLQVKNSPAQVQRDQDDPPAEVVGPSLAQPAALPTAQPGDFSSVVVFQTFKDGNSEIYLLNPGDEPVNLTQDPAQDTYPAWAPNGEWIAYLSDRTGKREVYVLNIANRRVVQLTQEPEIDWQGPLNWSPKGELIGLTGLRTGQGNQPWVYLVPLEGQKAGSQVAVALEGSRGGWSPEFTRPGGRLAYMTWDGVRSGVTVYERDTGRRFSASWEGGSEERIRSGTALDWMANGSGLAFLSGSPFDEQVGDGRSRVDAILTESQVVNLDLREQPPVMVSRWPFAFSSVTWSLDGSVIYLEDLGDARANDAPGTTPGACWTLQVRRPGNPPENVRPTLPNNLCVEGGLDSSSWTSDRRWLVVRARLPGELGQALYAIRMPGWQAVWQDDSATESDQAPVGTILRLTGADHPFEQWGGALAGSLPRVRPHGSPLSIDPKPVLINERDAAITDPTFVTGQVAFSLNNNGVSVLAKANPNGTGGFVLLATPGQNRCPVWSPDGRQLAYITSQTTLSADGQEDDEQVYRMQADGSSAIMVAGPAVVEPRAPARYLHCPVWSRDGRWLAGLTQAGARHYLVIAPVGRSGQQEPVWHPIGKPLANLDWMHGENQVVVAHQPLDGHLPLLTLFPLPAQDGESGVVQNLELPYQDGRIYDLVADPNTSQAAMLAIVPGRNNGRFAVLRLMSLSGDGSHSQFRMSEIPAGVDGAPGELRWLADGRIGLILHGPGTGLYKGLVLRFDPQLRFFTTLGLIEDRIASAAWSPDGTGLIYSSESGLWLLDISGKNNEKPRPAWLSPEPVNDLSWKQ